MSAGLIGKASPTSAGKALRLLNGNVSQGGTFRRAKLASFAINHELPAWNAANEPATQRGFWQKLLELLLPTPAKPNQRLHLAAQVIRDFVLISGGFALTVASPVLPGGAFTQHSAAFIARFLSASLGPAFFYGAIFTLVGYSERLYHPESVRAPRREMLVLSKAALLSTTVTSLGFAMCGTKTLAIATLSAALLSLMLQVLARLVSRCRPHCERNAMC